MTHIPPPIDRLWSTARTMLGDLCCLIGNTSALAARIWVDVQERRDIRRLLAPIEYIVRQLILFEALALAPTPTKPKTATKATRPPSRAPEPRFRLWPRDKPHPARIRMLGRATSVAEICRENARRAAALRMLAARRKMPARHVLLARRIQALARVMENPKRAIACLARKLRAIPKLAMKMALARLPRGQGREAAVEAAGICWPRLATNNTS